MQRAWVFVNPSMMEGWGITTIEANACGVPVVASNVPGLRESVQNPHTGYLVPYGDVDALATRITELLVSPELRGEMSKNAITWAQQFDWELSAQKTLALITNLTTVKT
jgi:glycosyltransferase involved in cell wall biosynthesis